VSKKTRIYFATDIHGSDTCFKKFINAASFYKASVIILGGDITGKVLIPIVVNSNGTVSFNTPTGQLIVAQQNEVPDHEKKLNGAGYYPIQIQSSEVERFNRDLSLKNESFHKLILDKVRNWMQIADSRLASNEDVCCYVQGGNDDALEVDDILNSSKRVRNTEGKALWIDSDHEMISTGYTNPTPWNCPRDIPEEQLDSKIRAMADLVKNVKTCVFNFHCPPFNTGLDLAPSLDKDLRPEVYGGGPMMKPVGSTSILNLIKERQPLLGLHGHVHESHGYVRIGRTLCLNPGSEYAEEILRGYLIDIEGEKVKQYVPVEG
jgi:uncharacterized protein